MFFFYAPYNILLLMWVKESRRLFFFLYDYYILGHYRRSKYNYQKMFFYIWHIFFNRKLTSDCPIRYLWNRPNNVSSTIFEVHVILVKIFKNFSTHTVCACSCNRGETNFQIRLYSWWFAFGQIFFAWYLMLI